MKLKKKFNAFVVPKIQKKESSSVRVAGNVTFFVCKNSSSGGDFWSAVNVDSRRVPEKDRILQGNNGLLALQCPNTQNINNGNRGHTAMVFDASRWRLFFIWRSQPEFLHGYELLKVSGSEYLLQERLLDLTTNMHFVTFVSVFGFDNAKIHDPAFVDPNDNCWNAGFRPSSVWLPDPKYKCTFENGVLLWTLTTKPTASNDGFFKEIADARPKTKRSRGPRKRPRNKPNKPKKPTISYPEPKKPTISYPVWLRSTPLPNQMLTIYMKRSDLHNCFLGNIAVRNNKRFALPKPLKGVPFKNTPFCVRDWCLLTQLDVTVNTIQYPAGALYGEHHTISRRRDPWY
jgi:hypothetical protein